MLTKFITSHNLDLLTGTHVNCSLSINSTAPKLWQILLLCQQSTQKQNTIVHCYFFLPFFSYLIWCSTTTDDAMHINWMTLNLNFVLGIFIMLFLVLWLCAVVYGLVIWSYLALHFGTIISGYFLQQHVVLIFFLF